MSDRFRILARIATRLSILALLCWGGWWLLMDARSPLPAGWNPLIPLDVTAAPGPLTGLQLRRALSSDERCDAALRTDAQFEQMTPLDGGAQCGIDPRLALTAVGSSAIAPVETTCSTALRLAMWERHALQPAAAAHLGQAVARLHHQGSYNCRAIRGGTRMSLHATAEAIDIRAVTLVDGRRLELAQGWTGPDATFWHAARDGACRWFATTLGPDYNAAHADHFHLQARGWGLCR